MCANGQFPVDLADILSSIFWQNDSTGVNQRPDFWTTIATKAHVYREDVVRLTENSVVLQEDELEGVDAIICATGWRPSYETFFNQSLAHDLGLPVPMQSASADTQDSSWNTADKAAEAEIGQRFPRLQHPPRHNTKIGHLSPFRLYRNIIPTDIQQYPGIVFLGHISVGNNFRAAEVQALWAVAYLSGIMKLPSRTEMERDVALKLAWCRKRYLSKGQLGHWLYYDLIPYTDTLLDDVGLKSQRRKGWWGDFWKPCVAADLGGLLEELREKSRQR
jgi:dimethylaniline monooxygenase (N-oxide forming)